jgi:hypothetical protein
MVREIGLFAALVVIALYPTATSAQGGKLKPGGKDLKPTQTWNGSVADVKLGAAKPVAGLATDKKAFAKMWKAWKVGPTVPAIDFDKQIVLVALSRASTVKIKARLDAKGNLLWNAVAPRDTREGFRYFIVALDKADVKTVNGVELPKD